MSSSSHTSSTGFIGLSLSACVKDILEGAVKIEDVRAIFSRTAVKNETDFARLIYSYGEDVWKDNPEEAKRIATELYESGRLIQPRLMSEPIYIRYDNELQPKEGKWVRLSDNKRIKFDENNQPVVSNVPNPTLVGEWKKFVKPQIPNRAPHQ